MKIMSKSNIVNLGRSELPTGSVMVSKHPHSPAQKLFRAILLVLGYHVCPMMIECCWKKNGRVYKLSPSDETEEMEETRIKKEWMDKIGQQAFQQKESIEGEWWRFEKAKVLEHGTENYRCRTITTSCRRLASWEQLRS